MATTKAQRVETQSALTRKALQQLAIIGGQMVQDEAITFEGRKFIVPEQFKGDLGGLTQFIERYVNAQQEMVIVDRVFNYRPHDGAHAVFLCLKDYFGYALSKARSGFFGSTPPTELAIPVGYVGGKLQHETVPWGDMVVPGLRGATMTITELHDAERGPLLRLYTRCRRVDKAIIEGFYIVVADYLESNSIYRGQAVNGGLEYIDVDAIDPTEFIYTVETWAQAETNILSPMRHADVLAKHGMKPRRVVLLEGIYGTGKTGLGRTAAKVAVANGWTALICRPAQDDPFQAMQTLSLYQPGMLFVEDIDILASKMDPEYVTRLLDAFDGFTSKNERMVLVLTTNRADKIHKGMLRPGRLDAVIHIGTMDRPGVEKLCYRVIGEQLEPDTDFDVVFEATAGFTPAFVREAIERTVRFTIARTGAVGRVNTEDLVNACNSLRAQLALQEAASDRVHERPALDTVFRQMISEGAGADPSAIYEAVDSVVENRLDGSYLYNQDGSPLGTLRTN